MKHRRIRLAGCGDHRSGYFNHEGYPDPTAGCAINGKSGIHSASDGRKPAEMEKTVNEELPSISEMERYLAGRDIQEGKNGRKKNHAGHGKNEP